VWVPLNGKTPPDEVPTVPEVVWPSPHWMLAV